MSGRSTRLGVVRVDAQPIVPAEDFPEFAKTEWNAAKAAYADAFRMFWSMHTLLHQPGQIRVSGTVTGALHSAKQMRDAADQIVVALDAIVAASRENGGKA